MQNRGALWIFTILLGLACLWQLSFSFITGRFERKAVPIVQQQVDSLFDVPANAGLDRDSAYLVFENKYMRSHGADIAYPVFGYTYHECKEREMNLGLDLKGGMAVTLEVSIPELIENLSGNSDNPQFVQAMANARARRATSDKDFISLFQEEWDKLGAENKMAAVFHTQENEKKFDREANNAAIVSKLREEAQAAINNTERIMRTRIDKFGVSQPSIQKQQFSGRIQIELPGVKDKERVRKVLQSTANLEFWETYDNTEVGPILDKVNTPLSAYLYPDLASKDSASTAGDSTAAAFERALSTGVTVKGMAKGVESGLIGFLESDKPVDKTTWFNFDRVTFQSGGATIDAAKSNEQLNNLAEIMKAYPAVRLKIGGYTDSTGKAESNQKLSQERAEAVVAELVTKGVTADRLEAEGYGAQHPVASNATEEGRAKNRRMALRVLSKGDGSENALANDSDAVDSTLAEEEPLDTAELRADAEKKYPLAVKMAPVVSAQRGFLKGSAVGYAQLADTADVNRLLATTIVRNALPGDCKLLWSAKPQNGVLTLHAMRVPKGTNGKPKLDGSAIIDAGQDFDMKGDVEVRMQMNAEGAQIWKVMTADNVGKAVAIVLDNLVYSAPFVQNEIPNGNSSITLGGGDVNKQIQEAEDLANILKAGALPAPARILDETVVGPSLGADNINNGIASFIISLLMVMLFMIAYYAGSGWIANVALLANVFVLLGSLASLQASLTLPGIAGIVLTVGMAVDANVLINERIREELRHGKMLKSAVDLGYKHAMSAIVDANVTHFIAAVILYYFGTGPIKSFGTTLAIGILTSLFTAIFISRLIITRRLDKGKTLTFWRPWNKDLFTSTHVDFMGKRKYFYLFSGALIAAGIISIFTQGFNYGVDFEGGRTYVVKFTNEVDVDQVREALEPEFFANGRQFTVNVKTYGGKDQVKVTTNFTPDSTGTEGDRIVEDHLHKGLAGIDPKHEIKESRKVDPTISDDIKRDAWLAVIVALAFIFVYIAIRFRTWQFGLGALLSLAHDALIVVGLYSLLWKIMPFSLEIDEHFIAAILTVIGYSINDTVVVFDRIREYLQDHKREPWRIVFNKAINSTLGRTINTSVTVLITLLVIFILGGVSIKGFVFAMLIGIAVGTYSSIFIASAVVVDLHKDTVPEPQGKPVPSAA